MICYFCYRTKLLWAIVSWIDSSVCLKFYIYSSLHLRSCTFVQYRQIVYFVEAILSSNVSMKTGICHRRWRTTSACSSIATFCRTFLCKSVQSCVSLFMYNYLQRGSISTHCTNVCKQKKKKLSLKEWFCETNDCFKKSLLSHTYLFYHIRQS